MFGYQILYVELFLLHPERRLRDLNMFICLFAII